MYAFEPQPRQCSSGEKLSQKTDARLLIASRAFALAASLIFALTYSKDLGLERRSIITAILVLSYFTCALLTAGLNLAFRRISSTTENKNAGNSFASLSLILAFICSLVTYCFLTVFSFYKEPIPRNLVIVSLLYSFFACLDNSGFEGSICNKKIKETAAILTITLTLQVSSYLLLEKTQVFTIAVNVLLSYLMGYSFSSISYYIINKPKFDLTEINFMIRESLHDLLYALTLNLIDRIDKIIIVALLPLASISKISMALTIYSLLRFLPDIQTRLLMLNMHIGLNMQVLIKFSRYLLPLTLLFIYPVAITYNFIVGKLLGMEWQITEFLLSLLAIQELFRGYFQYSNVKFIKMNSGADKIKMAIWSMCIFTLFCFVSTLFLAEWGVPIGMIFAYSLTAYMVKSRA